MRFIVKDFKAVQVETSPRLTFDSADTPEGIYRFYTGNITNDPAYEADKERVIVVTYNTRLQITGWNLVSLGGLAEATCHPREVFRPVIVRAAHGFVLVHNHPSGDPSPSCADTRITRAIKDAADLLKINLLDHVIIGAPAPGRTPYYSFREGGMI
ncbi:JAB domain-containing protein [Luteolibacter yonseiensis]|uniref:JAB domain-containing protein n=1 Tax=Luteolibacter yonseiensis TaxID=1144680 RepID=A0A934R5A7_9BACT|nr:JAB domain-containing protein [Luteolibacter yonseiensis]MBK1815730.1 JAB domain-containing protein [Luteolibacter yonseiensis]